MLRLSRPLSWLAAALCVWLALAPVSLPAQAEGRPPEGEDRPPRPQGPGGRPGRPDGPPGGGPRRPGGPGGPGGGGRGKTGGVVVSNRPLQDLWIPPLVEGKTFELTLAEGSKQFLAGKTPTIGFNGADFWGPTLVFNQGDQVQVHFKNNLKEVTTVHWHGLHLPAATDGGPHQTIAPGATWSPTWKVDNQAATYWYHPHPHELTQKQLTLGAGGLIIIRDPVEAKLALPRAYGVDDLPLVLASRRFKSDQRFSHDGDNDKYGDYPLTNGTLDAQVKLPAQVVRLRILNAENERGYILGLSDGRPFHLIATDGGLLEKPVALKRITLMVGERAEILVDLSADKPGATLDLMAYNSNQPFGFPGGEPDSGGANGSLLNNGDFRVLRVNVGAPTAHPVKAIPATLVKNRYPTEAEVTHRRTIQVADGRPFFNFDGQPFDMTRNDQVVKLGATEAWTVTNNNIFGHAFHIHDVQFKILARSDRAVAEWEQGWKDTAYLPKGASVTFVAKFADFASDTDPFMYHCHMGNHEDGGMMGQFLVVKDPATLKRDASGAIRFRAKMDHPLTAKLLAKAAGQANTKAPDFEWRDVDGQPTTLAKQAAARPVLLYFIEKECPCSRDAAVHVDQLQAAFGSAVRVVGLINADGETAAAWQAATQAKFPVLADADLAIAGAFQAERSATTVLVAPGGLIAKANPGYSAGTFQELATLLARQTRTLAPKLTFVGAPEKLTSGCPLKP